MRPTLHPVFTPRLAGSAPGQRQRGPRPRSSVPPHALPSFRRRRDPATACHTRPHHKVGSCDPNNAASTATASQPLRRLAQRYRARSPCLHPVVAAAIGHAADNTQYQRDVFVRAYRLGSLLESVGDPSALDYWLKAQQMLAALDAVGHEPPRTISRPRHAKDQQALATLPTGCSCGGRRRRFDATSSGSSPPARTQLRNAFVPIGSNRRCPYPAIVGAWTAYHVRLEAK